MITDPVLLNDWHPIASADAVRAGQTLPVQLLDEDLVVWRVGDRPLVWQDLCIHRGTRLSLGEVHENKLQCPYHGWTYDSEGRCVDIPAHPGQRPPAKARVKRYQAREQYGLIWACLGEPSVEIASFAEWEDDSFRKIVCGPYRFEASMPRVIENFLDIAHFPFVHADILGVPSQAEIRDYEAEILADGVSARNVRIYQPDPYGTGVGDYVSYTYRVFRPHIAYLEKESEGPRFSIYFAVAPHSTSQSTGWMVMAMNYVEDEPDEALRAWQDRIAGQDIPIVESQRPELLPLDLQAELHLRSDRISIAYRQWLRQIGLSFGTE